MTADGQIIHAEYFDELASEADIDWVSGLFGTGYSSGAQFLAEMFSKAILAERDRCALIAGYYAQACLETESDGSGYYACSALVDEIRNPKPPKPPMPAIDDDYLPF